MKTLRIPLDTLTFHEVTVANATFSDHLAVQVDIRLTKPEAERLAGIVGYAWAQHMRGEHLGAFERRGHSTIVFWGADVTKSVRDDIADGWFDFLDSLPRYVRQGTPLRTTDRRGPGTKGTRLVEGLGGDVEVTVFANVVEEA